MQRWPQESKPLTAPLLALVLTTPLAGGGGCAPSPSAGGFASDDPGATLYSIRQAAQERDASSVPHLVDALRSDDPAVRLLAEETLQALTGSLKGTQIGYRHFDPPAERDAAVDRWVVRLRQDGWLPPLETRSSVAAATTSL
jgi:hypothetical protein